jgi:hypothetical protein
MIFRVPVFALLASIVSAKTFCLAEDITADAAFVDSLLRHASVVEPSRHLNNNNNNNHKNQRDQSFLASYSIKYLGCSSLTTIPSNDDTSCSIYKSVNRGGRLVTQSLIRFALCPDMACGSCTGGGEYVVPMHQFIDAYTEAELSQQEWNCEQVRENCVCLEGDDVDECESNCYMAAGLEQCSSVKGGDNFHIQRYLECAGK